MSEEIVAPELDVGIRRALIGLVQGLALYAIFQIKPEPIISVPLTMAAFFVPLAIIQGWRALEYERLLIWASVATACIIGLGIYDVLRRGDLPSAKIIIDLGTVPPWLALAAILFIGQALVTAGAAERRLIARYERYFETAWAQGIQVAAAAAFTLALWLSLYVGAQLFKLINIQFLYDLIQKNWFYFPVTTLAIAFAIHITDVRPGIIRGMRTLAHTLLAWLLPLVTVLALGFVASLPFTGLAPLWATKHAAQLLLVVAAGLTILINAGYQDGAPERLSSPALRYASLIAAVLLTPVITLAAIALGLRVGQYGWTGDRVIVASCIVIGACYAVGYLWAAIATVRDRAHWLRPLEMTNIATSLAIIAVLLALFTPVADPARIGTASQLARLQSGRTPPDKFDYAYLRFDGARYGVAALRTIAALPKGQLADANDRATDMLTRKSRFEFHAVSPTTAAAQITVYPADRHLPQSFLDQNWSGADSNLLPDCLRNPGRTCDARMIDVDGDGKEEIVLQSDKDVKGTIFRLNDDAKWVVFGNYYARVPCQQLRENFRSGGMRVVPPALPDLDIGGLRVRVDTRFPGTCTN